MGKTKTGGAGISIAASDLAGKRRTSCESDHKLWTGRRVLVATPALREFDSLGLGGYTVQNPVPLATQWLHGIQKQQSPTL